MLNLDNEKCVGCGTKTAEWVVMGHPIGEQRKVCPDCIVWALGWCTTQAQPAIVARF